MRLVTFTAGEELLLGAKVDEGIINLNMGYIAYLHSRGEKDPYNKGGELIPDDMKRFLEMGGPALRAAEQTVDFCHKRIKTVKGPRGERILYPEAEVKLKAPIPRPGKIICLGLNYRDHAEEAKAKVPPHPVIFSKFATAVIGHEDPILYPKICRQLDYEIELAFIIGKGGRDIPEEEAYDHIAGYTIFHDVSARDIQFADKQWTRGKTLDTFAPMGPYLVTRDEIPDPHNLTMKLRVNGKVMQDSNTKNMIFKIPYIVAFLSQGITLEPGDVIATGTPAGVGIFRKPPALLQVGDVVELEIEGLGILRNHIVA